MKKALYNTPPKASSFNFVLNTQREMDNRDVIKSSKSGSAVTSVLPMISLIDHLSDVHEARTCTDSLQKLSTTDCKARLGLFCNRS